MLACLLACLMRTPVDRLQLRELDDKWSKLDILQDVGVQENTILLMTAPPVPPRRPPSRPARCRRSMSTASAASAREPSPSGPAPPGSLKSPP